MGIFQLVIVFYCKIMFYYSFPLTHIRSSNLEFRGIGPDIFCVSTHMKIIHNEAVVNDFDVGDYKT